MYVLHAGRWTVGNTEEKERVLPKEKHPQAHSGKPLRKKYATRKLNY